MQCIPIHTNTYDSVIISSCITHGEGNKQTLYKQTLYIMHYALCIMHLLY